MDMFAILDILMFGSKNSEENIEKILKVLDEFGFGSIGLKKEDFLEDTIIQLGYEPDRIDIVTEVEGLKFDSS